MKLAAPARPPHRRIRGSTLALAVIVSVIVTGLVMTLAWSAGQQSQMTSAYAKLDGAYAAAETGLNRAVWYVKKSKLATATSPMTGTINGYSYSVTWTTSGSSYILTSIGSNGT